jgi:hypothetical protein
MKNTYLSSYYLDLKIVNIEYNERISIIEKGFLTITIKGMVFPAILNFIEVLSKLKSSS